MSKQMTMVLVLGLGGLIVYKVFVAKPEVADAQVGGYDATGGRASPAEPDLFQSILNTANNLFSTVKTVAQSAPAQT